MNTIIYSRDFEPITVVDLPMDVLDSAEQKGGIMLALRNGEEAARGLIHVNCYKMPWIDGSLKPVLVAHEEELAMLLKPDWLVGQRAVVGAYQRTVKILSDKLKKIRPED
jgi:hypothetical protein